MAYRIEVAILLLPTGEKGPKRAFFAASKYYSKTRMDKNQTKTPTSEGKIRQQKSHLLKRVFLNGRIWFVSSEARVFKRYSNDWAIWVVGLAAFKSNVGKF